MPFFFLNSITSSGWNYNMLKYLVLCATKHTNGSRDLYEYVFLPQVFMISHFQDRLLEIQSFSTCPLSPLDLDISILLGVSPTKSGL